MRAQRPLGAATYPPPETRPTAARSWLDRRVACDGGQHLGEGAAHAMVNEVEGSGDRGFPVWQEPDDVTAPASAGHEDLRDVEIGPHLTCESDPLQGSEDLLR